MVYILYLYSMKNKWDSFEKGDLVEWLPELIPQRQKYNKSKNKNKAKMVHEFSVAKLYHPEVIWPMGVMEIIGMNPEYGIELLPYDPQVGKISNNLDQWETVQNFVRANEYQIMLSPTIYGEEVFIEGDLNKLGF